MALQFNPQSESGRTEHIISQFLLKSLHVILESRIPSLRPRDPSGEQTPGSRPRKRDKWFNLALGDRPAALENLNFWHRNVMDPMIIDVILIHEVASASGVDDLFNSSQAMMETTIERWVVHYEHQKSIPQSGDGSGSYKKTYKKSIILLRSLYSTLRLLPAFRVFRQLTSSSQSYSHLDTLRIIHSSHIIYRDMDPYKYRPSSAYNTSFCTTNSGLPVWNNNSALTVGTRGPVLLEDYHLIEKVAAFHRERIPERVVHARGASAKGFFEVTHDITHLTCADFLRAPGVQTPLITRFSTVIHERGSPETIRDPRGFAIKFYTREGNFDLVGNNFPVFFIRDGMKFPDVIHAFKPNPKSHIQENWRILDFCSHIPESLNTFAWFYDDVGIPLNYRHMEGFGVHTYTLINKTGKATYVKFHWKPTCGVKNLLEEEAIIVGGTNHSHATKDLYDSISTGNYPEWKLWIQTMDPEDEDKFDFDPLDVTKIWPEDMFPLQPVGRMVLNRNIDNFFAENEQLAFSPALVVPGIYYSDDKMLQCRTFAYNDTQRHRLGPNYLMLPVNAPKCAHHNNHYDGAMNFMHRDEEVDYFPSRYDPVRHAEKYPIPTRILHGKRERSIIEKENNFKQAGDRYRSFAPDRQERFLRRIVEGLSDPRLTHELRAIWISYWTQCDRSLGQKIASRLNVKPSM